MAVSVDHNSTMSDLREFIKENKMQITTSGKHILLIRILEVESNPITTIIIEVIGSRLEVEIRDLLLIHQWHRGRVA